MTSAQMITNFLLEYDRVSSLSAPGYENSEILYFLNKSQFDLEDQLYTSKQWGLLTSLVKTQTYAKGGGWTAALRYDSTVELDLTSGTSRFLYYINAYCSVTRSGFPTISNAKILRAENITKEQVPQFVAAGLSVPIFRFPKAYWDGIKLLIMYDGYTTMGDNIYVEYLARPKTLVTSVSDVDNEATTCELHESLHEEIVTRAVKFALTATDPQKAALTTQINNA